MALLGRNAARPFRPIEGAFADIRGRALVIIQESALSSRRCGGSVAWRPRRASTHPAGPIGAFTVCGAPWRCIE